MATPTQANKPALQAVATPPVSTPFSASHNHLAFSPHGPKSVQPSPQHIKKSPANSNTLYGYPAAAGNHPTNSSFGAGYDSPSAAMALGAVGVGGLGELGMEGIGTPSASGLAGVGLGTLGTGGARGDEQDRTRRLGVVVDILKANKGRLSEAGIERLARRVGLECLWETGMGGSSGTSRTLIIAGSALALDIDFTSNVVQKVSLSFPESPESVTKHTEKAGEILMRDLRVKEGESPLTKTLDRFAANLDRLAVLDRLSVIPGLDCHEAIAGVYEGLERLHEWEVERLKEGGELAGKGREVLEREVLCTGSGKPLMHARDRLGLSLDYWEEKRRISSEMRQGREFKTWSLLVECAPLPAMGLFAPLRVSNNWISADILKENPPAEEMFLAPEGGPVLDWQEPENTMLPSTNPPKADSMDGVEQPTQKFPEVMFVAKFDPPIVVPYSLAVSIYNSTNTTIDPYQMSTFDGLLFPSTPGDRIDQGEARTIKQNVLVPVFSKDGERSLKMHSNTLMIDEIDYGRTLTEIPFSHPNQLVGMLPALRQYAFLSTLLGNSFGSTANLAPTPENEEEPNKNGHPSFEDFMSQSQTRKTSKRKTAKKDGAFPLDVFFTTQPNPRLVLIFPFKGRTANVTFDIKLNGTVEVVSQNILPRDDGAMEQQQEGKFKGKGRQLSVNDLGRMLEITEDLGIWVEFVARRLD